MTLEELKSDLNNRLPKSQNLFSTKLFKTDFKAFSRRSFDDLHRRYRIYGVTEKMLMQALKEEGFQARICRQIRKPVFYRPKGGIDGSDDKIWGTEHSAFASLEDCNVVGSKFNVTYLNKLFDSLESD